MREIESDFREFCMSYTVDMVISCLRETAPQPHWLIRNVHVDMFNKIDKFKIPFVGGFFFYL